MAVWHKRGAKGLTVAVLFCLVAALVLVASDDTPSADAHPPRQETYTYKVPVQKTRTVPAYNYKTVCIYLGCWQVRVAPYTRTVTYTVMETRTGTRTVHDPHPTPTPAPKPCTGLFCGMTQTQICAAAGLPLNFSGTGCGPDPTPDPTPQPTPDPTPTTNGNGGGNTPDPTPPQTRPRINIPPEGVTCPAGYQHGLAPHGVEPPYAEPSGKFWRSATATAPVTPTHTCWQLHSGGCPAGQTFARATYSQNPNRLLTGYADPPQAPDGKRWNQESANADYACYKLVDKKTRTPWRDIAKGIKDVIVKVLEKQGEAELARARSYQALDKVIYSYICTPWGHIGGAYGSYKTASAAHQAALEMGVFSMKLGPGFL